MKQEEPHVTEIRYLFLDCSLSIDFSLVQKNSSPVYEHARERKAAPQQFESYFL